jgi:hypothetical protein
MYSIASSKVQSGVASALYGQEIIKKKMEFETRGLIAGAEAV